MGSDNCGTLTAKTQSAFVRSERPLIDRIGVGIGRTELRPIPVIQPTPRVSRKRTSPVCSGTAYLGWNPTVLDSQPTRPDSVRISRRPIATWPSVWTSGFTTFRCWLSAFCLKQGSAQVWSVDKLVRHSWPRVAQIRTSFYPTE